MLLGSFYVFSSEKFFFWGGGTAESDHTLYLLGVIITQFRALRELMFDVLPNLA